MRFFLIVFCFVSASCSVMEKMKESDRVSSEWRDRQNKMKQQSVVAQREVENEVLSCEEMLNKCLQDESKEDILDCREKLKTCEYSFESLRSERGNKGMLKIKEVHEKCFTYGYQRYDMKKMPKNAIIPWNPSVRGYGSFKTFSECVTAKEQDDLGQPFGNVCIRHDWCKNQNSLINSDSNNR